MSTTVVWFRDDLRLADNPALSAACRDGNVVCVYVLDEAPRQRPIGGAARWWLHHSLTRLSEALLGVGGRLVLRRGAAESVIAAVASESGADRVVWNRRYAPANIARDRALKARLTAGGVSVESFNATLLREPWEVMNQSGGPMKVFTPFWRAARALGPFRAPIPAPLRVPPPVAIPSDDLADWSLLPTRPDWSGGLVATWTPGEAGARALLTRFLAKGARGYASHRDRPDFASTSRLSPHLRFGEISPVQIGSVAGMALASGDLSERDHDKFMAEIGWREFAYHLLYHSDDIATVNVQRRFDAFPWRENPSLLRRWQKGRTGYPLVDAGMRELWQTGWMHNRVRMVVASFLVKHLLIDWREGERWFWDTLVDADVANNPASWQWVAGSGADAAPYFRIFNPVSQGESHDPDGAYVRRYVPELARLPSSLIHRPWQATPLELASAGVRLDDTYPRPIVDHVTARDTALAAFETLKSAA